jgi:hypothetical protein
MFAMIMIVVGLLIAFSVPLAVKRSAAKDVTANNKPGDDDDLSNELELSRGITREKVTEPERAKLTAPLTSGAKTRSHPVLRPTSYPPHVGTSRRGQKLQGHFGASIWN